MELMLADVKVAHLCWTMFLSWPMKLAELLKRPKAAQTVAVRAQKTSEAWVLHLEGQVLMLGDLILAPD